MTLSARICTVVLTSLVFACGGSEDDGSGGATTADATSGDTAGEQAVTVGVYTMGGDGSYTDTGIELVFEVGVECQTWSRMTMMGDMVDPDPHLHYNAADDTSYDGTTFTWTEFGPEHDQAGIDATCAAGMNGATKSVNATDYYEDHDGVYLRIKSVD
jgi:hypothetical protein